MPARIHGGFARIHEMTARIHKKPARIPGEPTRIRAVLQKHCHRPIEISPRPAECARLTSGTEDRAQSWKTAPWPGRASKTRLRVEERSVAHWSTWQHDKNGRQRFTMWAAAPQTRRMTTRAPTRHRVAPIRCTHPADWAEQYSRAKRKHVALKKCLCSCRPST